MKARCMIGAVAAVCVLGAFGCGAAHRRALVSYPESVSAGSSDSIGGAIFAPQTQARIQAQKAAEETGMAVVLVNDSAN
jgi:hypothetical protein